MSKKQPKAPEPPKPSASMVDQYTPYGSSVYKPIEGTDRYSNTVTLSPEQQAILDSQNKITGGLYGVGEGLIKRINDTYAQPFDFSNLTPLKKSLDFSSLPSGVSNVATTGRADGGQIQDRLDFSQFGRLPSGQDFSQDRQRVEDALYSRNTARLDPQYQQEERDLSTRLANQGVMEGSDAWRNAMDDFARRKESAYAGARNDSIITGGAEQSRLFGLDMGARQQGVGEVTTQGTFANNAQAQRFGQQFQNNDQEFGQGLSNANLNNGLRSQMVDEQMKDAQLREAGRNMEIRMRTLNRQSPTADLAALLQMGGGVTNPQFNNQIDLGALNTANYAGAQNAYNAQVGAQNAQTGGLYGLAGAAASAAIPFLFSDIRLKDRIIWTGQKDGINIYEFSYLEDDKRYRGVMAQEVEHIPGAVVPDADGYLKVDYSKLPVAFEEVSHG